ncbi:response regulator [Magnetofaba australis]|uniref:Putative multisensor signal transduction histidine kinase n=1 Tax=Magnetofaba australis IT-1 TaxID=1434232 RepID=A0A1Y2K313_9PROT|nr:response regulator [Magnetofaba australis]OSM02383.1 putative multisensor signal transduction histidine kinase [Magnetofaba australis IT-1]
MNSDTKPNNKPTVLIVDDEEATFQIIKAALGGDYAFEYADNGKRGLDKILNAKPDLVLLDLEMPVMNGYEVLGSLDLTVAHDFDVIVLTSDNHLSVIERCYKLGVNLFMRKPANIFEIRGVVQRTIASRQYKRSLVLEKLYVKSLLDSSESAIIGLSQDLKITLANPAALSMLEYDMEEIVNIELRDLFADQIEANMAEVFANAGRLFSKGPPGRAKAETRLP